MTFLAVGNPLTRFTFILTRKKNKIGDSFEIFISLHGSMGKYATNSVKIRESTKISSLYLKNIISVLQSFAFKCAFAVLSHDVCVTQLFNNTL